MSLKKELKTLTQALDQDICERIKYCESLEKRIKYLEDKVECQKETNEKNIVTQTELFHLFAKQLKCTIEKEDYIATNYEFTNHENKKVVRQRFVLTPIKIGSALKIKPKK